ncbi:MAG: RNA-binding protein [Planctomycetes bacterium]|nr:RNA-binding protein [Planctomycetota bacterium]
MANIYVGNLPFQTTEDDLREMFGAHGTVDRVNIIMDKMTGRSRGFGFVEMPDDAAAQAAITALNGKDLGGRALTVNEARPKTETRSGGGGHRGGGGYGGGRSRGY